jgi:demethylmenaquinone methyltransferase/2-methoxy-6-polyprenyl-1,4-benzoquinol methylase
VFFAFWLSHVPPERFADFWALLRDWLAPGGRVLFVDEDPGEAGKEVYPEPGGYVVERRLEDGSAHRVVKVFAGPEELRRRLSGAGWRSAIRPAGPDWLVGEAWA